MPKRKASRIDRVIAPAPAPDVSAIRFHFRRYFVTDIEFRELPLVADGPQTGREGTVEMSFGVIVGVAENEKDAEVRIIATVTPDPKRMPYHLRLSVVGQFSVENGTRDQLQMFAQDHALAVLFPYLRQAVDRITIDGRYGVVRLDLLNVRQMFKPENWAPAVVKDGNIVQDEIPK